MKISKDLSFSERIARRNLILKIVLVLMVVYMIVVGELGLGDTRYMTRLAQNLSTIIFFGGAGYVIYKIFQNKKLLNNQQLLKEKMLNEMDEMNLTLYEKSGGVVWDAILICQLFVTLTTALINMPAFYSSLVTLAVIVVTKLCSLLYYKIKGL